MKINKILMIVGMISLLASSGSARDSLPAVTPDDSNPDINPALRSIKRQTIDEKVMLNRLTEELNSLIPSVYTLGECHQPILGLSPSGLASLKRIMDIARNPYLGPGEIYANHFLDPCKGHRLLPFIALVAKFDAMAGFNAAFAIGDVAERHILEEIQSTAVEALLIIANNHPPTTAEQESQGLYYDTPAIEAIAELEVIFNRVKTEAVTEKILTGIAELATKSPSQDVRQAAQAFLERNAPNLHESTIREHRRATTGTTMRRGGGYDE